MRTVDTVAMAFRAIRRNVVRSALTTLGIIIGVASVIAMVQLGQAATASVTRAISSMGSNLLFVSPGVDQRGPGGTRGVARTFSEADIEALRNEVPDILVAPAVQTSKSIVYGNVNSRIGITGTTNDFFRIREWPVVKGREFEAQEARTAAPVCVVGQTIVDEIIGGELIGVSLRVGRTSCRVIGVLESKGSSMGQDQDETIITPLRTAQRRLIGSNDIHLLYVSALVDGTTTSVKSGIEEVLRRRRRIDHPDDDDFHVRDMAEITAAVEGTTATLTALLGAIAAVSLLVGGIGIMNIMLVSVTERTREIGIRLAIGAKTTDVLWQFLVESIVLSTFGGLVGIALGLAGTYFATSQMDLPMTVSVETIAVGFGFAVAIGIVFGFLPARKAARLNPIDALRHE